jgi:iron complex outermembrane receptor protein
VADSDGHLHAYRTVSLIINAFAVFTAALGIVVSPVSVHAAEPSNSGLTDLSIQELMNIEVTSASKKAQKFSEVPAAIFVITNEDIRRSGARNVPEALRLAPGVDVAAIGGGRYAVTIRGANSRFANKLLVLIDGRSVYTPLFSGVIWESVGPVLGDIDRIEVIRGPGAAIWGANAVNGVINIISKHSAETQGVRISAGTGTQDRGFATVQYGGRLSQDTTYRVYGKTDVHSASDDEFGQPGNDGYHSSRAGFRADTQTDDSALSAQGEVYGLASGDRLTAPEITAPYSSTSDVQQHNSGGNFLGRWDKTFSGDQDLTLQTYFDFATFSVPDYSVSQQKTFDVEFEHRIHAITRNDITWGASYRALGYRADGSDLVSFTPSSRILRIAGAFVQDEVRLTPDSLRLTLGGKVEHDTYTGAHFMPDVRLLWNITDSAQLWAAVSKAVRTPSAGEHDGEVRYANSVIPPFATVPSAPCDPMHSSPTYCAIQITTVPSDTGVERLTDYEVGYRSEFADTFSFDLTGFIAHYTQLVLPTPGVPQLANENGTYYLSVPVPVNNGNSAREMGTELAADWRFNSRWRLESSYSRAWLKHNAGDIIGMFDASPRTLLSLRSSMDIAGTQWDLWLRHVGKRLPTQTTGSVPEFTTLDSALSWHLPHDLEVSLVGKDLLDVRHLEFIPDAISSQPLTVQRSAYIKITWVY